MNTESYLSAIAGIDEDLIACAEKKDKTYSKSKKTKTIVSAAVCAAVIAITVFALSKTGGFSKPVKLPADETENAAGTLPAETSKVDPAAVTDNASEENQTGGTETAPEAAVSDGYSGGADEEQNKGQNKTEPVTRNVEPQTEKPTEAPASAAPETTEPNRPVSYRSDFSADCGMVNWNGKTVTYSLWNILESSGDGDTLALLVKPLSYDSSFVYEGKTPEQYADAWDEERNLPEKLNMLLKDGDSLKYGTLLYEEGTPDGEKWAESLYEEKISFYGDDILNAYIQNGMFLRDKLENDIRAAGECNDARNKYFEAKAAFAAAIAGEINGTVTDTGCIRINLTKSAFAAFSYAKAELVFDTAVIGDGTATDLMAVPSDE